MEKGQPCYSLQTGGLNHEEVPNSISLFFPFPSEAKQNNIVSVYDKKNTYLI